MRAFRRVLLVRHGVSSWNVERRIQGQDGTGLTDRGHEQAELTAALVAEAHPDAVLVTSDLQRCVETVAPVERLLGREAVRDPRLRERHFGSWQGRLVAEVAEEEPERFRRWASGEDVVPEVGGESGEELAERVADAVLEHLAAVPHDGTLVCVTHGGPVHHGTRRLLDLPEGALGGVANASVTALGFVGLPGEPEARRWLDGWSGDLHLPLDLRSTTGATQDTKPSNEDARGEQEPAPPAVGR